MNEKFNNFTVSFTKQEYLIAYYVATEVKWEYVDCVLSHQADEVNANKLSPMLNEVMKMKELKIMLLSKHSC